MNGHGPKVLVGGLVTVAAAVIAAVVFGEMGGGLGSRSAWSALGLGLVAGVASAAFVPRTRAPLRRPSGWVEWAVVACFALFAFRSFCWLFFENGDQWMFLSPNNLGDLSIHLTMIGYFANGAPFWPANPIFAAAPLHYPFGVDLWNALLVLAGADLMRGLIWTGLFGSAATGFALWRWGGPFALAGFLFNGGLFGLSLLTEWKIDAAQGEVAWKSIPLALFVTQRGLLYAIPAGLLLLWSWRSRFLHRVKAVPLPVELFLYATLPLFHLHTFLFLSLLLGGWFLLSFLEGVWQELFPPSSRLALLRFVALAFVPATLLVWKLTGGLQSGGQIRFQPGWMQHDQNPFLFWFGNFGIFPLCVAAVLWHLLRKPTVDKAREAAIVLPCVAIFLLTCFVLFAPWEWDNTKLMLWSYLALLPAIGALLARQHIVVRWATCFLLFFSGFFVLWGGLGGTGYSLAHRSELDNIRPMVAKIPITATFAGHPTFNHPLLLLGRKMVAGYEGHLQSHGIPYQPAFEALQRVLRGERGWENDAHALGIDYLFWGREEKQAYGDWPPASGIGAIAPFAESPWGKLYYLGAKPPPQGR
ncbi:MAG TPA: hypothetical protein VNQ90_18900 [Chthoniobacteraceae bacterium]|nr:hypothetical protein [Chthoniobacteraceae bacterium]